MGRIAQFNQYFAPRESYAQNLREYVWAASSSFINISRGRNHVRNICENALRRGDAMRRPVSSGFRADKGDAWHRPYGQDCREFIEVE